MMKSHTNRLFFSLIIVGLLFGLNGCSSIQVSQDYDATANFSVIETVQWLDETDQIKPKAATFAAQNPLIAERITRAISAELNQKDITFVDKNPSGYVTYHVEMVSKPRTNQMTTSFGFGSYGRFGGFGFQTSPDRDYYDQGKLVIDLFNNQKKLIWRGISTRYIEEHTAPDELTETIQEVVKKLLDQYPPKTANR